MLADFRTHLRLFLAFSEEKAHRAGLSPQQHQLLLAVRALGPKAPLRELAQRLVLRHHSTVGLADRCEQAGLVRRVKVGPDGRRVYLELTAKGARVLRRLSLAHKDELRRRGPALVKALERLLGKR